MKKLRLFDSLKLVLATVTCTFILNVAHATALPAGYTELEYLESTGTQYIDFTDAVSITFPITRIESQARVSLSRVTTTRQFVMALGNANVAHYVECDTQGTWGLGTGQTGTPVSVIADKIYNLKSIITPESHTLYVDGVLSRSINEYQSGTNLVPRTLFSLATSGSYKGTYVRIHAYTLYNNNDLILNLIPAKRNSDNVIGMYDVVSGQFFTNAGTDEFVAGPAVPIKIATTKYNEQQFAPVETRLDAAVAAVDTVVTQTMTQAQQIDQIANEKQTRPDEGCTAKYCLLVEDEDGTPHWYPIAGANGVAHNLPAGYTELQYIESTGTQYINTGYIPNSNTRWELDNEYTETPPAKHFFNGVYQAVSGYQPARFDIALAETGLILNYGATNNVNSNVSSFINTRYMYVVDAKNNKWAYNDTTGSFPSYSNMATITKPLYLFARNDSSGVDRFTKQRTYSSKIYDDGILVRDFVPAKNSSGVVGMYDLADPNPSTAFYTNAGTGTFVAGPDM